MPVYLRGRRRRRVNVDFDVYKSAPHHSSGSRVESGFWIDKRDRLTRAAVPSSSIPTSPTPPRPQSRRGRPDQIRTLVREFRDKLFTDIFPAAPKFQDPGIRRDDSHRRHRQIVREEFGKGNDFCQKITYRTGKVRVSRQVKREDGTKRP